MPPDFSLEEGLGAATGLRIAGLDEAGRGPLAGPVTAAAVRLCPKAHAASRYVGLDDSKLILPELREELHALLLAEAEVGVGWASVEEIDRLNILQASLLAMRRALACLSPCDGVLVDGNQLPKDLTCTAQAVVGGDGLCLSIAAASVIAKVERDRVMVALDGECPGYGWAANKGYGTPEHRAALQRLGPTAHHRRSFAPVRAILEGAVARPIA